MGLLQVCDDNDVERITDQRNEGSARVLPSAIGLGAQSAAKVFKHYMLSLRINSDVIATVFLRFIHCSMRLKRRTSDLMLICQLKLKPWGVSYDPLSSFCNVISAIRNSGNRTFRTFNIQTAHKTLTRQVRQFRLEKAQQRGRYKSSCKSEMFLPQR